MSVCLYYQAKLERSQVWFIVGILRSYEHLVFERTVDKQSSLFEFFVPIQLERYFLELMALFEKKGMVTDLEKLPNRLVDRAL
ncbi:MAG: hypothetical protein BWY54_00378 [Candidatus Dependentiae bacterium ADurb.Bin331]|nr:MAG: hypothetical protein BWY54_00378 [Candidatus Dependentiae bacterium ADurb.Bin331]